MPRKQSPVAQAISAAESAAEPTLQPTVMKRKTDHGGKPPHKRVRHIPALTLQSATPLAADTGPGEQLAKGMAADIGPGEQFAKEMVVDTGPGEQPAKETAADIGPEEQLVKEMASITAMLAADPHISTWRFKHPHSPKPQPDDARPIQHSPLEAAADFYLGTLRLPLSSFTSRWSVGIANRMVNSAHEDQLCSNFKIVGVDRCTAVNHVLVASNADTWRKLVDKHTPEVALKLRKQVQDLDESGSVVLARSIFTRRDLKRAHMWPLITDWEEITGSKAELIAGQHRLGALKKFLTQRGDDVSTSTDAWWVADIYDTGAMPRQLNLKLRENRRTSILPDAHGDIWMILLAQSEFDKNISKDVPNGPDIHAKLNELLDLQTETGFPIKRLITLWRHRIWRPFISEWCGTGYGRSTFNLSSWNVVARLRMEKYWQKPMQEILLFIKSMCPVAAPHVRREDWDLLRTLNEPLPRPAEKVYDLFYPLKQNLHPTPQRYQERIRNPSLLPSLQDTEYNKALGFILRNPNFKFEDAVEWVTTARKYGPDLLRLMEHISAWVNPQYQQPERLQGKATKGRGRKPHRDSVPDSGGAAGMTDDNKPPIYLQFISAFKLKYPSTGPDKLEVHAAKLQHTVADYFLTRRDEFLQPIVRHYLEDFDEENYIDRFTVPVWQQLLVTVRTAIGPHLSHPSLKKYNEKGAIRTISTKPTTSIHIHMVNSLKSCREITENAALNEDSALDNLRSMVYEVTVDWATHWCGKGSRAHNNLRLKGRQKDIMRVDQDFVRFSKLLEEIGDRPSSAPKSYEPETILISSGGSNSPSYHSSGGDDGDGDEAGNNSEDKTRSSSISLSHLLRKRSPLLRPRVPPSNKIKATYPQGM